MILSYSLNILHVSYFNNCSTISVWMMDYSSFMGEIPTSSVFALYYLDPEEA